MCMPTYDVYCPAGADTTRQPWVTKRGNLANGEQPSKCQVCDSPALTAAHDLDPGQNAYWINLNFGRNRLSSEVNENYLDGYRVRLIDNNMQPVQGADNKSVEVKKVPTDNKVTTNCCDPMTYSVSLTGTLPSSGYSAPYHFEITPMVTISGMKYYLPVSHTNEIVDFQDSRPASVYPAQIAMTVADPCAFAAEPNSKNVLKTSIAYASAGVTESMVSVDNISPQGVACSGGRRLQRRLQSGSVQVDYQIMVPPGSTVVPDANTLDANVFAATVTSEAVRLGLDTMTGTVSASGITQTVSNPIVKSGYVDPNAPTTAAHPMAGISSLMVLIIALAGRQ